MEKNGNDDNSIKIIESCYIVDSYSSQRKKENSIKFNNSYEIIEFIKIIGNHKYQADFIYEFKNLLISGGTDNNLIIYNQKYNIIYNEKIKDSICNVIELYLGKDNKNFVILICTKSNLKILDYNILTKNYFIAMKEVLYEKEIYMCLSCINYIKDYNILCTKEGIFIINNLNNKIINIKEKKIMNKSYRAGIQINNKIYAFTSNSASKNGEDKIIFYNIISDKFFHEIKNYSFILSSNGLYLIKNKEELNGNILLCACKKYMKGQKNGILLINLINSNIDMGISNYFYDTKNFEVYCFCPILIVKNNNKIIGVDYIDKEYKNNIEIEDTKFFFVSAFDDKKREGIIKLYKIIIPDKIENTKIKFLQNIEIDNKEDFKGFEGQIKSMIQSRITGNIIVTCANGKIYLFTQPNLSLYLNRYK